MRNKEYVHIYIYIIVKYRRKSSNERQRRGWKNKVKICVQEMSLKDVYYILPTQGRDQHSTPVSKIMKILVAPKRGDVLGN